MSSPETDNLQKQSRFKTSRAKPGNTLLDEIGLATIGSEGLSIFGSNHVNKSLLNYGLELEWFNKNSS